MRFVAALLLAIAVAVSCGIASNRGLGALLGPMALICVILPPLIALECDRRALLMTAACVGGIAAVWLTGVFTSKISLGQWIACVAVLAAFALVCCGATRVTSRVAGSIGRRLDDKSNAASFAGLAVVVFIALAWLSWPVWFSPIATDQTVACLAPAHPLLAINRVVIDSMGAWTQQRLMYQHTTLGQDVPLTLPRSIWPAVLLHAIVGSIGMAVSARWDRRVRLAAPLDS